MKQFKKKQCRPFATISMAASSGLVFFSLCGGLMAQSANVFEPKVASENTESVPGSKKDVPPPGPVDSQPSRFAGQDIEPYVAARAAVFSMRNRSTGPFGLFQDPNMKPEIKRTPSRLPIKRQAALPPTPLEDIVKLIRVTTIMPGEKEFLVGVRKFKEGDEFTLEFQGKAMKIKIVEVTAKQILFRDLQKGEEAALKTGMLPPGMLVAGGEEMRPPGMVSSADNVPLQLGSQRPKNR